MRNPIKRFDRYLAAGKSKYFLGEVAYYYDDELKIYLANVIIAANCRRHGYGKAGLDLLCKAAQNAKIPELYDSIAVDNPGIKLFLKCDFQEEYRAEDIIMLKKQLI